MEGKEGKHKVVEVKGPQEVKETEEEGKGTKETKPRTPADEVRPPKLL